MSSKLHDLFYQVMDTYTEVRNSKFGDTPFRKILPNGIVEYLNKYFESAEKQEQYKIKGSIGNGNWVTVPWVNIMDVRITDTPQRGVYITYLFNAENKQLFLVLMEGVTELKKKLKRQFKDMLPKMIEDTRIKLGFTDKRGEIETGDNDFDLGTIEFKRYTLADLPNDEELLKDLNEYLSLYTKYYDVCFSNQTKDVRIWKVSHGDVKEIVQNREIFLERKVAVVHRNTGKNQGELFRTGIKKGDYFYLCYGNNIQLLGQFTSDESVDNPQLMNGWIEREYVQIKEPLTQEKYAGTRKNWEPDGYSTCWQVPSDELSMFEEKILVPYFGLRLEDLMMSELHDDIDVVNKFSDNSVKYPLNQILYGPPGTGKTYNSAIYAVAICDKKKIEEVEKWDYETEVLPRYRELVDANRISFVTFHQSYGYEDFIEGIKPVLNNDNDSSSDLEYVLQSGIFKNIATVAGSKNNFDEAYDKLLSNIEENGEKIQLETKTHHPYEIGINSNLNLKLITSGSDTANGVLTKDKLRLCSEGKEPKYWKTYYYPVVEYLKANCGLKDNSEVSDDNKVPYVIIIDEINRGNISKIFGELITLIEPTKRKGAAEELELILPCSHEPFSVPDNVYIIGTMNTADRSIALMDTALRRRFQFIEKMPDVSRLEGITIDGLNVDKMLETINNRIECLYDREHTIGHAFFMGLKKEENRTVEKLAEIFKKSIIPLLQEYFYEDYEKIRLVLGDNAKENKDLQFVQAMQIDKRTIFRGDADDIQVSDYKYVINEKAFDDINSYIQIVGDVKEEKKTE